MSLPRVVVPVLAVVALALAGTAIWLAFDRPDTDDPSRGDTPDKMVTMPDVGAQPLSSARESLAAAGFAGSMAVVPEALDESSAIVIRQRPVAGSTLGSDGQVILAVVDAAEVFPNFLLIRNETSDPLWIVEPSTRSRLDPHEQLRYASAPACEGQLLKAFTPAGDLVSRHTGACDGSTWRITGEAD